MAVRYPPIAALRALEAAARHLSYTRAADELHITQSAVSHQIHHAEELWGLKLFEKRGRRLVLTEAGQTLAPIARDFLERIANALEELQPAEARHSLRVTLLQSFAFRWLVPRLGHFNDRHPDIEIWISTSEELADFSMDNVDVGIRLGLGNWPNLNCTLLLKEYVLPVCSPRFLERYGRPQEPRDLLKLPLLRRKPGDICPRWRDWFRDAGLDVKRIPSGTMFPDTGLAVLAALDSQGVALARSAHVIDDIAAGRLIKLFDVYSESNVKYYLVTSRGRENDAQIAAFRAWLLGEAAESQARFDALMADTTGRIPKLPPTG